MNATLSAELRKLRATRSTTAAALTVVGAAAALAVANVSLAGTDGNAALDADTFHHVVRAPTAIASFAMLVVGVLASTGEYRHNTVVPTLLAQPRRGVVAAAKLAAVGLVALVLAVVTAGVSAAVGWPLLIARDAPTAHLAAVPAAVAVLAGTTVLYGVLGVALGLLVRNQAVAMTAALLWYFVVERILPVVVRAPHAADWLPRGAADAFARLGDAPAGSVSGPSPLVGGALLAAYAGGLAVVATVALARRDQV